MGADAFAHMAAELIAPGAVMRLYMVGVRVKATLAEGMATHDPQTYPLLVKGGYVKQGGEAA